MKIKRIIKILVVVFFILIWNLSLLQPQVGRGRERLKGTVTNEESKPLESALVVLKFRGHYRRNVKTADVDFIPASETTYQNLKFETKTNKKGQYRFIGLGFGQWEVIATFNGLQPASQIFVVDKNITLKPITLVLTKDAPQPTAPTPAEIEGDLDEETKKLLKNPKKLFQLGETMLEHEELEKAIVCFHLASQAKPKWSAPYLKLGYTYFNLGKDKEAVENFKKFLELNPKSTEAPTIKELIEILKEE